MNESKEDLIPKEEGYDTDSKVSYDTKFESNGNTDDNPLPAAVAEGPRSKRRRVCAKSEEDTKASVGVVKQDVDIQAQKDLVDIPPGDDIDPNDASYPNSLPRTWTPTSTVHTSSHDSAITRLEPDQMDLDHPNLHPIPSRDNTPSDGSPERHSSVDSQAASQGAQSKSAPTPKPAKQRKLVMDAVLVPSLARVLDNEAKMRRILNPKVTVKKSEYAVLPADTVLQRLKGCTEYKVDLDPVIRDVCVSRLFISKTYGGNPQSVSPDLSPHFQQMHEYRGFMFVNLELHPYGPQFPGHPGLFHDYHEGPDIHRVFSKVSGKPSLWEYMGQYILTRVQPLTGHEWKSLGPQFHERWVAKLAGKSEWARSYRCAISLRHTLGREPTEVEYEDGLALNDPYANVTKKQIMDAFCRSQERTNVLAMQCVGYDVEFQREVAAKFPNFVYVPEKKGKKKGKKNTKGATKKVNSRKLVKKETASPAKLNGGRKRKHASLEDEEAMSESEDDEDGDWA